MYSLYFHIPFCTHRCAYCDFNTYAGQEDSIPAYVDALCKEIEFVGDSLTTKDTKDTKEEEKLGDLRGLGGSATQRGVHTIFFGGGTPSLLSSLQFDSIFKSIRDNFDLTDDCEITIEANPGTVNFESLRELHAIGINRISFGVQSANPFELRMLERAHSFFNVIDAVTSARKAGFDNLNLDLIYGLPEQSLESWRTTVNRILDLHPEHISAYALTLEHGTPFGRWSSRGLLPIPDPDLAAEMYEWASETLEANGYVQYEISNWAKDDRRPQTADRPSSMVLRPPSLACKHNLQYWRGLPYLAFGAGAHGYADGYRYSNVLRIKTYIERLNGNRESKIGSRILDSQTPTPDSRITSLVFPLSPATVNHHKQTLKDDMSEFMMTGLRLTREGISSPEFEKRFGQSLNDVFGKEIEELIRLGLIEQTDSPLPMGEGLGRRAELVEAVRVKLTNRARLLGNQVFMRFV